MIDFKKSGAVATLALGLTAATFSESAKDSGRPTPPETPPLEKKALPKANQNGEALIASEPNSAQQLLLRIPQNLLNNSNSTASMEKQLTASGKVPIQNFETGTSPHIMSAEEITTASKRRYLADQQVMPLPKNQTPADSLGKFAGYIASRVAKAVDERVAEERPFSLSQRWAYNNPQAVIKGTRDEYLGEVQKKFAKDQIWIKDYPDLDKRARGDGLISIREAWSMRKPDQDIAHKSLYDSPEYPKYKLVDKKYALELENSLRQESRFDQISKPETTANELKRYYYFSQERQLGASPAGDTKVKNFLASAKEIGQDKTLDSSSKREKIYYKLREIIQDDQTVQGGLLLLDEQKKFPVETREAFIAGGGACRHLAIPLYTAYNNAGIHTEIHGNGQHAWLESENPDGKIVTIDPNAYYNYTEFPGSRGGMALLPDGKIARSLSSVK